MRPAWFASLTAGAALALSQPSAAADRHADAAAVISALLRHHAGGIGCVQRKIGWATLADERDVAVDALRRDGAKPSPERVAAALTDTLVYSRADTAAADGHGPIDHAAGRAAVAIAMRRAHTQYLHEIDRRMSPAAPPTDNATCGVAVASPAFGGGYAFVDMVRGGTGFTFVLTKRASAWRVIAARVTVIT